MLLEQNSTAASSVSLTHKFRLLVLSHISYNSHWYLIIFFDLRSFQFQHLVFKFRNSFFTLLLLRISTELFDFLFLVLFFLFVCLCLCVSSFQAFRLVFLQPLLSFLLNFSFISLIDFLILFNCLGL